jgi:uncharacterized membrane protein
MLKTEETKVAAAIAASFGLLTVWLVLDMFNVLGLAIALTGIVLLLLFARMILKKPKDARDERSERCSFLASRNGFVALIMAVPAYGIIALATGLSAYWIIDNLSIIWGVGVMIYMLSYLYYLREE